MMIDGNLALLNDYEDRYADDMREQDAWQDSIEDAMRTDIRCMMEDKVWEGQECHCCGNIIHGNGYIKGWYAPGASQNEIIYNFFCEDCKCCM